MGLLLLKSVAGGAVIFLILLAERHSSSVLAAAATTVPIGTLIGLLAFGARSSEAAEAFLRSAVLALPVWITFAVSAYATMRLSGDWRLAAGGGMLAWSAAAFLYLRSG